MDEFEDIKELAISESRRLLEESSQLLTKGVNPEQVIAEVFQKIHTVKSNVALIPQAKSLSVSLQNLETVLARLRDEKSALKEDVTSSVLNIVDLTLTHLENIQDSKNNIELEKEIMKSSVNLRMRMASLKK